MSKQGLSVAIVGHTNAGKTSLMRTLLRDSEFGEVADQAGTTRHVEGSALEVGDGAAISLFDTPGLEDSMRLLHVLSGLFPDKKVDGVECIYYFLEHLYDYPQFDQEAMVLRTLLSNDLIFYVIDLREPILGKYRDELQILSYAAKPVIPVLNYTQQGAANLDKWKAQLARLNFHAFVAFDNVHFQFADELKIYRKMQTLIADKEAFLEKFIEQRQKQWQTRYHAAAAIVANLIIDATSFRYRSEDDDREIALATTQLQTLVRNAENRAAKQLLKLYQFRPEDLHNSELPVEQAGWELDLFSIDNFQEFGIKLGSNIAKGAGAGVVVDLAVGGLTMGAAAVTGGIAGALWGVGERYYDEIKAKVRGYRHICLNDATLQVLWFRQQKLLHILQKRGHASFTKIDYQVTDTENQLPEQWDKWVQQLRSHPKWSSLEKKESRFDDDKRKELLQVLTEALET